MDRKASFTQVLRPIVHKQALCFCSLSHQVQYAGSPCKCMGTQPLTLISQVWGCVSLKASTVRLGPLTDMLVKLGCAAVSPYTYIDCLHGASGNCSHINKQPIYGVHDSMCMRPKTVPITGKEGRNTISTPCVQVTGPSFPLSFRLPETL